MRVEITIPACNEEHRLLTSIPALRRFLHDVTLFEASLVIADNGSTDHTGEIAQELRRKHPDISVVSIPERGRGLALRTVWSRSQADIVAYMDADLSVKLEFLPLLIHGISIGYDLAVGSRLLQASQNVRCRKREILSRGYNSLVKLLFQNRFSDAQCGFKAVRRDVVQRILPHIKDTGWFFDSELMLLAENTIFAFLKSPLTALKTGTRVSTSCALPPQTPAGSCACA